MLNLRQQQQYALSNAALYRYTVNMIGKSGDCFRTTVYVFGSDRYLYYVEAILFCRTDGALPCPLSG